jgi:hypothetical protein
MTCCHQLPVYWQRPADGEYLGLLESGREVREMKLLTKALEKRFALVGSQAEEKDPLVLAKFFNPTGAGTWYATEYDPSDRIFFGYVSIFGDWNDEWGSFSLQELESYKGRLGLGIERDLYFEEKRASEVIEKHE